MSMFKSPIFNQFKDAIPYEEPVLSQNQNLSKLGNRPQFKSPIFNQFEDAIPYEGETSQSTEQPVLSQQNEQELPEEEGYSPVQRLMQFGRGFASTPAMIADIYQQHVTAPLNELTGAGLEAIGATEKAKGFKERALHQRQSNLTEKTQNTFNEWAGKELTPKDITGRILETAGELSFPIPFGAGKAIKAAKGSNVALAKTAGKGLAKDVAKGAGGATALEAHRGNELFDESNPILHGVEDFVTALVGMSLTDKGIGTLSATKKKIFGEISNDLNSLVKESESFKPNLEGVNLKNKAIGKVLSIGSKPNEKIIKAAKEEGIQLPFNVVLNNDAHNFLANNFLKSMFVNKAYKDVIKNADKDMIESVINKIKASSDNLSPSAASSEAREILSAEKELIKNNSDELYNIAGSYLKPTESVNAKPLVDAIHDIQPKIADIPSGDMAFIQKRIVEIGKKWGLLPNLKEFENIPDNANLMKMIMESLKKDVPTVSLEKVLTQRQAFLKDINYEKDIPGVKNFMNHLIGGLDKMIDKSTNKEFLTHFRAANKYFKENTVDRMRSDMAVSLMKGDLPKEAFQYMGSAREIRQLKKIFGDSPKATKIIDELKKAKLQSIIKDKMVDASGNMKYGALSNMFNNKSGNQDVLKELLGDKNYTGMKRLADIAQAFTKSGKELANPSGTAFASRDLKDFGDLAKGLMSFFVPAAGYIAGGGLGVLESITSVNLISRLVANPKAIHAATEYALAAQKNNSRSSAVWARRLGKLIQENPQAVLESQKPNNK